MDGFTNQHEKQANSLLQSGLSPYRARVVITVNSVTDVLPPAGKTIFIALETEYSICHTEPQHIPNDTGEHVELGKAINFFTIFGRSEDDELLSDEIIKNGYPAANFLQSIAKLATMEQGITAKVRDCGVVNLVEFVYGMHSITDKKIGMKLGGSMAITVECFLERWESGGPWSVASAHLSKGGEIGTHQVLEKHVTSKKYGEMYETTYSGGVWTEYPLIWRMEQPRKMKFWSIDGPDDSDSQSDGELEKVCEMRYRVPRRRVKDSCKVGEMAKTGKMSRLQKYRVWAVEPIIVEVDEPSSLEMLKKTAFQRRVTTADIKFVEVSGDNNNDDDDDNDEDDCDDDDDDDDNDVFVNGDFDDGDFDVNDNNKTSRRISDCCGREDEDNIRAF